MKALVRAQVVCLVIACIGVVIMLGAYLFNMVPNCAGCGANIGAGLLFLTGAFIAGIGAAGAALATILRAIWHP